MLVNNNAINGGTFEYLTNEQLHHIHMASLEILEKTGMVVYDDEALQLLKDGGAYVKGNRVRIPADMIERAIRSAPSKITFCGVDGSRKMHLYRNNVYYGLGTDLPNFTDPYTGKIRPTVLSDIENVAKVTQVTEGIDFVASLGLAADVPQELVDLYQHKALRTYCNKPHWTTATDYGNAKALIDMAAEAAGGYEELRKNPTIGFYNEPISPLINSKEAVQKLLLSAEYGIPVTWASGIIAGATGPATLAGSIALGNAEGLGGLVMHQLKREGAPYILGLVGSTMDMRSAISCYGGPELPMINAVVGQLGRFYNLPSYGTGGCTDSGVVDAQAGMEAMYSNMMAALGGTNLVHDNGYLGAGLVGSLEMIMLDGEIAQFIKRTQRGIDVNEDTLCLDLIHKVGPGGQFMAETHTLENYKKETFYPEFLNRKQLQIWETDGSLTMLEKLNERAKKIIETEMAFVTSEKLLASYETIIVRRKEEIAQGKFHKEDF